MVLNISGPGGSGKTTLIKKTCELYPNNYSHLVSYTTRAKRNGEQNGLDYWFIQQEEYESYIDWELTRKSSLGLYGVKKEDLFNYSTQFLITNFPPNGVIKMRKLGLNVKTFFIDLSVEECKKRMMLRGDEEQSILERIEKDSTEVSVENIMKVLSNDEVFILNGMKTIDVLVSEFINKSKNLLFLE